MSHTIAAVSTGHQISAIGILRLSGDDCAAVADRVFHPESGKLLSQCRARMLILGKLQDKEGRTIDHCMAVYCKAPHSYTGEDTVEFHCHDTERCRSPGCCRS